MISHIKGMIEEKFGINGIIVDVNGVGYEMLVPVPDFENAEDYDSYGKKGGRKYYYGKKY